MLLTVENFVFRERLGEEEGLKIIKDAGFDGVDYSFCLFSDKTYMLGDDYIERAKHVKTLLKKLKLKCDQAHAPFSLKYGEDFSLKNKNYRDIVRSIEAASIIGAKSIVVHAIVVPKVEEQVSFNLKYYNKLKPYAKKFGIKIAIENLHSVLNSVERYNQVLRKVDKKYFCGCLDIGHAYNVGYQVDEYIPKMEKGIVKFLHLQDTEGEFDKHWIPYSGSIAWDKLLKALKDYGFKGNFNFEIIHCFDNVPNDLLLPMLKYAVSVGRYMMKKYKKIK